MLCVGDAGFSALGVLALGIVTFGNAVAGADATSITDGRTGFDFLSAAAILVSKVVLHCAI